MLKVIVAGSRSFSNYDFLKRKLDSEIEDGKCEIISGTARGADLLGERYAKERGLEVKRFPADWNKHGKRAGYLRNEQMALYACPNGILFAFWDGISNGTKHMIDLAKRNGLKVVVYQ